MHKYRAQLHDVIENTLALEIAFTSWLILHSLTTILSHDQCTCGYSPWTPH